jgi:DNA polymerase elongation subunit (family B)
MYVDGFFDKKKDAIMVSERDTAGNRHIREYPARYTVYYKDPKGKFRSMKDEPLSKIICKSTADLMSERHIYGDRLYEADMNPVYTCLANNYLNIDPPKLNVAFFDIESDWDEETGYSSPEDASLPITSIAVHLQWLDKLICLAVPPKTLSMAEATELTKDFPDTYLFAKESEMLDTFLSLIEDADVLSAWNGEGYDIPYTVNRVAKVLSKTDTKRFCLFDQYPKKRIFKRYGKDAVTYDLIGRVHMDSLELYRKFTYEERHSYKLDAIAEYELNEKKTEYSGTLDQLYNNDFKTFIEYNRQDVALLDKLDKKLTLVALANAIAHDNTVLLPTTMGAVATTEQAIINETHRLGMMVSKRPPRDPHGNNEETESTQAAGAYVAHPRVGIHEWIGSYDINSLYPSTLRALNMSPETIIGQLRPAMTDAYIQQQMANKKSFAEAWEGVFGSLEYLAVMERDASVMITVDWENGESNVLPANEVHKMIFDCNQPWILSANGTIFTYEREGIIPGLLKRWYSERQHIQGIVKRFNNLDKGIELQEEYHLIQNTSEPTALLRDLNWTLFDELINSTNVNEFATFISTYGLHIVDKKLRAINQKELELAIEFWDLANKIKKLALNSLYGALLNPGCRFNDKRLGQSTTLTGRQIVKHMTAETNRNFTGEYDYLGETILYNDTDSIFGDSVIQTSTGAYSIESLYNSCKEFNIVGDKEYGYDKDMQVLSYDNINDTAYYGNINYIYRHKVSKALYEIEDELGNKIVVTSDHSVMVERNNELLEIKPQDIQLDDILISIKDMK